MSKTSLKINHSKHISVSLFFLIYILIGLTIYQDYGVSWDEWRERVTGIVSLNYVGDVFNIESIKNDPSLHKFKEYNTPLADYWQNVYGVAFQLPATYLERLLGYEYITQIFLFRHLMVFWVFVVGVYAVYRLAERRFSDWRLGLLCALFLVLSPRLFAHSFFNSKDAVFMAIFAVSLDSAVKYLLNPTKKNACWHAFTNAILIDLRIVGIIISAATITIICIRIIKREVSCAKTLQSLLIYLLFLIAMVMAFWPYLWSNPYNNFLTAFERMADYPWKGSVLYLGKEIRASEIPWHYVPVWIFITTPLIYILFFVSGCGAIIRKTVSNRFRIWNNDNELQDVIFIAFFIVPIIAVIVTEAVLYDGWRQMYFVYPAFLMIALRGFVLFFKWRPPVLQKTWTLGVNTITIIGLASILAWMIKAHPYQNVFFNKLVGSDVRTKFDMDYWGLSNSEALQYIADNDQRESISIWKGSTMNLRVSKLMLKSKDFKRINEVKSERDADYVITNYRIDSTDYGTNGKGYKQFYEIKVDDEPIISVYSR